MSAILSWGIPVAAGAVIIHKAVTSIPYSSIAKSVRSFFGCGVKHPPLTKINVGIQDRIVEVKAKIQKNTDDNVKLSDELNELETMLFADETIQKTNTYVAREVIPKINKLDTVLAEIKRQEDLLNGSSNNNSLVNLNSVYNNSLMDLSYLSNNVNHSRSNNNNSSNQLIQRNRLTSQTTATNAVVKQFESDYLANKFPGNSQKQDARWDPQAVTRSLLAAYPQNARLTIMNNLPQHIKDDLGIV